MNLTPWIFGLVITLGMGTIAAQADSAQADREDAAALSSREFAGQAMCGKGAAAVWSSNYEMDCLKELP